MKYYRETVLNQVHKKLNELDILIKALGDEALAGAEVKALQVSDCALTKIAEIKTLLLESK